MLLASLLRARTLCTAIRQPQQPVGGFQLSSLGFKSTKSDLLVKTIQAEDEKRLTEFLGREYFQRESVSRALGGLTATEFQYVLDEIYPQVLQEGISTLAECSKSGKILGASLAGLESLGHREKPHHFAVKNIFPRKVKIVYELEEKLLEGINLYTSYGVNKILHFAATSVEKESESCGIGMMLILENEARAIQHGAQLSYGEATGVRMKTNMASQLNYDVIKEITFRINPYGTSVFEKEGTDMFFSLMVKRLT